MAKTLVYQLYPISWECYGGLPAMKDYLWTIKQLEVDYVWVSPLYPSPRYDHGYDVADYMAIDPRFGTMEDFDMFVGVAHNMGMKVLMDLVLNHTSTEHKWFSEHPTYYYWRDEDMPGWHNLFNSGEAWKYDENYGKYYLHLFHEKQADLRWFINGNLNKGLAQEFRKIVNFWITRHKVDGFRLDMPQAINKDFSSDELMLESLIFGDKAVEVLNAVFDGKRKDLFLMMECLDPTFGELTEYYADNTPVGFVANTLLKDEFKYGEFSYTELVERRFKDLIAQQAQNPHFILDLESHDAPRFLSRAPYWMKHEDVLNMMFGSDTQAICLYQGQERGFRNPSESDLPDSLMLELDAQTAMRHARGASLMDLRLMSRANARIPLPPSVLGEHKWTYSNPLLTRDWAHYWKNKR